MESDIDISGIDGSLYTTEYRGYDSRIGRWWSVDPLSDSIPSWSPYRYSYCNPLFFNDPFGQLETKYVDQKGNTLIETNDNKDDVVVIPNENVDEFTNMVMHNFEKGKLHDESVNADLAETYGYPIEEMYSHANSRYPMPGNDPYNYGYADSYSRTYEGIPSGRKFLDFWVNLGAGAEKGEGSNFVIGRHSGSIDAKQDVSIGNMNKLYPEIKNNQPIIKLTPNIDKYVKNQY